jgi:YVTN family beta-propeller protein
VANSESESVEALDSRTGEVLATVEIPGTPHGLAFTPDGKELWVANLKRNSVAIVDTAKRKVVDTVRVGNRPHLIVIRP